MTTQIYAIRDIVAGTTMQPVFMQNESVAKRWFRHVMTNTEILSDNPEDYELLKIGYFEDGNGNEEEPRIDGGKAVRLCNGKEVINERESNEILQ